MQANYTKATRWWRCAIKLVNTAVQIQSRYQQLCHQFERGSTLRLLLAEDGAKSEWVSYLYVELLSKFMRLKAAGVSLSPSLIGQLARTVMNDAPLYI